MQKANKENNFLYNPKLKDRARRLRYAGTKAEAYLWKFVLRKKAQGYTFLRQRPIMNYIVDFMCPELMLIIEADGVSHLEPGAEKRDKIRQNKLEDVGFTVLRFDDDAILNNISMVSTLISQEVEHLSKNKLSSPLPSLG